MLAYQRVSPTLTKIYGTDQWLQIFFSNCLEFHWSFQRISDPKILQIPFYVFLPVRGPVVMFKLVYKPIPLVNPTVTVPIFTNLAIERRLVIPPCRGISWYFCGFAKISHSYPSGIDNPNYKPNYGIIFIICSGIDNPIHVQIILTINFSENIRELCHRIVQCFSQLYIYIYTLWFNLLPSY